MIKKLYDSTDLREASDILDIILLQVLQLQLSLSF